MKKELEVDHVLPTTDGGLEICWCWRSYPTAEEVVDEVITKMEDC